MKHKHKTMLIDKAIYHIIPIMEGLMKGEVQVIAFDLPRDLLKRMSEANTWVDEQGFKKLQEVAGSDSSHTLLPSPWHFLNASSRKQSVYSPSLHLALVPLLMKTTCDTLTSLLLVPPNPHLKVVCFAWNCFSQKIIPWLLPRCAS